MASQKISIMISSRCDITVAGEKLSNFRKTLRDQINKQKVFNGKAFDVWINEYETSMPGDKDALEVCLKNAKDADIFLCLYNGDAGWNGICHKELEAAYNQSPGKVIIIHIDPNVCKDIGNKGKQPNSNAKQINKAFQKYVEDLNLFRGPRITQNISELEEDIEKALHEMALKLMKSGAREVSKSVRDRGPALDWARMTFEAREEAMVKKALEALRRNGAGGKNDEWVVKVGTRRVLFVPNAIPSSFSVPAARERVGQPFLNDHEFSERLKGGVIGPVHIIACSQNITEAQAMRLLGFPDAIIVKSGFGIYVADKIQKIQICFIARCADESTTGHQVEKFLEWLEKDSGEVDNFISRAQSRAKIVKLIDKEA